MPDHSEQQITLSESQLEALAARIAEKIVANIGAAPITMAHEIVVLGSLKVDLTAHQAFVGDTLIHLKPREFALLVALAQNAGRVLTREQLLALAWPEPEAIESLRTVDIHIARIRLQLGTAAVLLQTVQKIGYKIVQPALTQSV